MQSNPSALMRLEEELTGCRKCERLVAWREKMAVEKRRAYLDQEYWGRPVPGFGDKAARVLVVGLAPGAHGSNRTGRMFTGDASGDFLYPALHRAGFASGPKAEHRADGLKLKGMFITAVCRCAPPENKVTPQEIQNCRGYLLAEMDLLTDLRVVVALGQIAYGSIQAIYRERGAALDGFEFGHNRVIKMGDQLPWLITSYHPSRQNTQTGRLTAPMFDLIWQKAAELAELKPSA